MFNTECRYPLQPSFDDNNVYVPVNALRVDISDGQVYRDTDVVKRGGRLYDKLNHTFEFKDIIYCDITWLFDYEACLCIPTLHHLQSCRTSRSTADDGCRAGQTYHCSGGLCTCCLYGV